MVCHVIVCVVVFNLMFIKLVEIPKNTFWKKKQLWVWLLNFISNLTIQNIMLLIVEYELIHNVYTS